MPNLGFIPSPGLAIFHQNASMLDAEGHLPYGKDGADYRTLEFCCLHNEHNYESYIEKFTQPFTIVKVFSLKTYTIKPRNKRYTFRNSDNTC